MTLQSLRKAVGVVQQDSFLFTTSIENNIAYGNPWAQRDPHRAGSRVCAAAQLRRRACRPATTTVVGERGVSLSGGQRQRLTIARSLMLRPSVLVFDDSTAAIDAGTEQRIRAAMQRFAKDRVTIIISHRLSSLMHADQILFVEKAAGSSSAARTRNCWRSAGATARSTICSCGRKTTGRRWREPHDVDTEATTTKEDTQRPADQGRRRLAPRRGRGFRQGLRSAHRAAHLELRAARIRAGSSSRSPRCWCSR